MHERKISLSFYDDVICFIKLKSMNTKSADHYTYSNLSYSMYLKQNSGQQN